MELELPVVQEVEVVEGGVLRLEDEVVVCDGVVRVELELEVVDWEEVVELELELEVVLCEVVGELGVDV